MCIFDVGRVTFFVLVGFFRVHPGHSYYSVRSSILIYYYSVARVNIVSLSILINSCMEFSCTIRVTSEIYSLVAHGL